MKKIFATLLALAASATSAVAQDVAIKSNLLYDATLTANLGVEARLADRWTIDVSGNLNAWTVDGHRWKHWLVQPEARFWLCEAFSGHFFAAHLLGGQYNFGNLDMDFTFLGTDFSLLKDYRFQGWMGGVGLGYGYSWILNRHWNIEAEIAIGWVYTRYDKFECVGCGAKIEKKHPHNYVGPTKAGVNLIYSF